MENGRKALRGEGSGWRGSGVYGERREKKWEAEGGVERGDKGKKREGRGVKGKWGGKWKDRRSVPANKYLRLYTSIVFCSVLTTTVSSLCTV